MTNLSELWSSLTGAAMLFDLDGLRSTIVSTQDDGLRAASYDGPSARSASVDSHPERMVLAERRDPTRNDLALLAHHETRYIAAVYEIATRSHSGPFPNDWRSARIGAKRLDDMAAIEVLETTGQRPARFVHQAGDALHDLELLAGRHLARTPTEDEKHWDSKAYNDNTVCAWHLAIHDRHRRPRADGLNICEVCRQLIELLGQKPPRWLLEAEVDLRESRPLAWRAALSRCMDELGVVRDRSA